METDPSRPGVLVHEWLEPTGGSENVLEVMASTFPTLSILTPWNNAPHRFPPSRVQESWLSTSVFRNRKAAAALVLPFVWRSMSIPDDTEWALISSHMFAHHLQVPAATRKLVYVHTPARYVWNPELDARGSSMLAKAAALPLKMIDRRRAVEADALAANSAYVRDRIKATWNRRADVIHPPVEVEAIRAGLRTKSWLDADDAAELERLPGEFLLGVSRFVDYKKLDYVIHAGERLGLPVVLAGGGPERGALAARAAAATVPVVMIDRPSSAVLHEIYHRATALVFAAVEDFGIIPVEAMASGTPVIGTAKGGLLETVVPGRNGALITDLSDDAQLQRAYREVQELKRAEIAESAGAFSREAFQVRIRAWVEMHVEQPAA